MRGGWQAGSQKVLGDSRMRDYNRGMLRLVEGDETPRRLNGEDVLRKVADVIEPHLAGLALDDPLRGALASLVHSAPPRR